MESNTFETVEISSLIEEIGTNFPLINEVFSIIEPMNIKAPVGLGIDTKRDDIIVTFNNLINRTKYISQIGTLLTALKSYFQVPVDIEFACDGSNLYLLQCRQQSYFGIDTKPEPIPKNIPADDILFTARKHVSNAIVPNIAYIVYVDPKKYGESSYLSELEDVARAIGYLNRILPKKTFVLMGPGRWGTRDDIRLGVKVAYSDINNTAMLIEIAQNKNGYVPELSFGTHFFQDLVESNIFYLPLYPEDSSVNYNYEFFEKAPNTLERFLEQYSHISHILKVINIREISYGRILRILMNSDEEQAVAFLSQDIVEESTSSNSNIINLAESQTWRLRMAEAFVNTINASKFNIEGVYLTGSVFYENAMPDSDIDFLILMHANNEMKDDFLLWAEGWNASLSSINYNRTGIRKEKLLDITIIDDIDFEQSQYFQELLNPLMHKSKKLL
ncbi:MAG: hypothetical protein A2X64_11265 [Ignavibacteria bacterium GWF2_33_9]|nr:MAG: hypothetical protein A2X64_11265 [Ignavibacteria bacterium GWF2_33_9]